MSLNQIQKRLDVSTPGRGLFEITSDVQSWVQASQMTEGLVHLLLRHTSASLLIQENADPDVKVDLERFFKRLCPDGDSIYDHTLEGPDDMPAHVRAASDIRASEHSFCGRSLVVGNLAGHLFMGTSHSSSQPPDRWASGRRLI